MSCLRKTDRNRSLLMKDLGKDLNMEINKSHVISNLPCVLQDTYTGFYAPKGWFWYSDKPWVSNIYEAKVYRNSSGAKNALRGSEATAKVVEFHTELKKFMK